MVSLSNLANIDDRTWDQKFGKRCFCGKSWGDSSPCGDNRADWTAKQAISMLFADRKSSTCINCDRFTTANRKYCYDCGRANVKARNSVDRHARVNSTCAWCGVEFEMRADKKGQRFCSITCANKERHAK